jgi:hypothetical protein
MQLSSAFLSVLPEKLFLLFPVVVCLESTRGTFITLRCLWVDKRNKLRCNLPVAGGASVEITTSALYNAKDASPDKRHLSANGGTGSTLLRSYPSMPRPRFSYISAFIRPVCSILCYALVASLPAFYPRSMIVAKAAAPVTVHSVSKHPSALQPRALMN